MPYCPMYGQLRQPLPYYPVYGRHPHAFPHPSAGGAADTFPQGGRHSHETKATTMYHPFFQFVLPRLGQAALDILLYLNFFTAAAAAAGGTVAGFVLRPAAGADGAAGLYQPGPAGPWHRLCRASGDLFTASAPALGWCCAASAARRWLLGTFFWLGGITPWLLTAGIMWWGRRRAAPLYDPLPPYDPQKAAGRPAAHRADQRHSPPEAARQWITPASLSCARRSRPATPTCWC